MTGAEMAVTEFAAIEGDLSPVDPAVLGGVEEAADTPLFAIEKTRIFAAVDDLETPSLILRRLDRSGEGRQIFSRPDIGVKPHRASPQSSRKRLPGAVEVVIDAAARPA